MTEHHVYREWSAGYVLGALEPAERRQFEDHLTECEECRREIAEFAPLPGLLAKLGGAEFERTPSGVTTVVAERVRSEWVALNRSRKRWRWIASAAAAAVVVMALSSVLPRPDQDIVWTVESATASGTVTLESRAWGTAVHLDLENLPWREGYIAWVIDDGGNAQQIGVWLPTDSGTAILDSTSSIALDSVVMVAVSNLEGDEQLLTASG
ncbi:MAG: zf-HC2 domain-containing protein [Acidimicrobiia bacterium]